MLLEFSHFNDIHCQCLPNPQIASERGTLMPLFTRDLAPFRDQYYGDPCHRTYIIRMAKLGDSAQVWGNGCAARVRGHAINSGHTLLAAS